MNNQLTETDKKILLMIYNIGQTVFDTTEYLVVDGEFFNRNDLYNLMCKLGLEDSI